MVDKISQSMLTLAENSKDFKTALRFMLKCEIQLLLDRLAELGDESLLVIANKSEESASHFGSVCAETYLQACATSFNFSLKDTFLQHCLERSPSTTIHPKPQLSGQMQDLKSLRSEKSVAQEQVQHNSSVVSSVPAMISNNSVTPAQSQGQAFTGAMNDMMFRAAQMLQMGHQVNMMNRQMMMGNTVSSGYNRQQLQANRFNPYQKQAGQTTGLSQKATTKQDDLHLNRAICRHFARGHCWQGNMCAFLHVHQDPDSSEDKDTKDSKDKKSIDSTTDFRKDVNEEVTASSTAFSNTALK